MKHILDEISDYVLVINYRGEVKYCNNKLLLKLDYDKDDIYKVNIDDILLNQNFKVEDVLNNKDKLNIDLQFYSKLNNITNLDTKIIQGKYNDEECIFIIGRDLSDRYYLKEDLEMLLDEAPFMAWIRDVNDRFLYANKSSLKYTKEDKYSILGKRYEEIWNPYYKEKYEKQYKLILGSKKSLIYEEEINKNKHFEISLSPILDDSGDTKYIVGTSKDITVNKNLELEIKKTHNNMSALYDILNKTDKNVNINKLLENMINDIAKHLKVDGMVLLLSDSKREGVIPLIKFGMSNITYKNIDFMKFTKEECDKYLQDNKEGIFHIDDKSIMYKNKNLIRSKIEYSGVYNIIIDDEFIGILGIGYKKENLPIGNIDKFMKTIASEIGVFIKKYRLSEKVKVELERRKKIENELELFLKTATDIMGIISKDGYIKKVNSKWTETLGWSCEELLTMNLGELVHKDNLYDAINYPKPMNEDNIIRMNNKCLCKNGEYKWLEFSGILIEDKDEFIITARDITAEKILEEERKSLEEAIHLESIKNEFFANISHEFKTPINIILGTMQLLNNKIDKGQIYSNNDTHLSKYINSIKQNSYRLLRLVNNLIDMTRIDTGFYELQLRNYNIIKIIEDITMSVTNYTEDKDINIIFDTDCEETIIACDPDKIERIMLNILSNAIKYTDKYGEIIVNIKHKNNKVIVSIKDNGIGISKEKLKLIFERFGQVNHSLTRRCEGSGIGLSLVKSLVEMHKGKIYVNSEEEVGSEFIFELPIVKIEKEEETIINKGNYLDFQIEKCNIEFSDIYSL